MTRRNTRPAPELPQEMRDLKEYLSHLAFQIDNRIKSLHVNPSGLGTGSHSLHGKHSTVQVENGETAYFELLAPHAIGEFKEVLIRFIPSGTGTYDYTVNLSYGKTGEDENGTTKTASDTGVAVTDDQIGEIDITSLFDDAEGGDQIGVEVVMDGFSTTTDLHILSLELKYV